MFRLHATAAVVVAGSFALLAGCATAPGAGGDRTATITRTTHGIPHIIAPDVETLAYGVAYAHAQDHVCQTADYIVTVRGQRAQTFGGGAAQSLFGLRAMPNEVIDAFIAAHMDDTRLAQQWATVSASGQAMARGYVAGYNRFLADHAGRLPAACNGQGTPLNASQLAMTLADYHRMNEVTAIQAGLGAFADAWIGARPPAPAARTSALDSPAARTSQPIWPTSEQMLAEGRALGLVDSPFGSNAWAFGRDVTANGRGVLLGNPHFPWVGTNRFWQMHLTVPGVMDVMGASIGRTPFVQIGFNKDVAWSHTVSTGKRFTLHELTLAPNDPTSYLVDGQAQKMSSRTVQVNVRNADGSTTQRPYTVWSTRYGPVIINPRLGLNWTATTAYALKDANSGNVRSNETWLGFAQATSVADMRNAMRNLGIPWVNTIAADRAGNALYADVSVVPDVSNAQLQRCAPSAPAAGLLRSPLSIAVLNGSRGDCDWNRDATSPVPGLTPIERMPVAVRSDWVHNSNDSFVYTHPQQRFEGISIMVGDDLVRRPRTRAGLTEVPELIGRGKVTVEAVQRQLFANQNFMARMVLPDLLAACAAGAGAPTPEARDGCAALRAWDRTNNPESRGAHVFREFWRAGTTIPNVYRVPFDRAQPVATPNGLRMDDAATATRVWEALTQAVQKIRAAGVALDAPLASVQHAIFDPATVGQAIGVHGGDEVEGVLNNIGDRGAPGITARGLRIDYGTSYVQTVTFDERGPVAHALLTYGQSTTPGSPHVLDQLRLYARKEWPRLPFHPEEIAAQRIGEPLRLTRP